jgi:hypothetical protein
MEGLAGILQQIVKRTPTESEARERWRAGAGAQAIDANYQKNLYPSCPNCRDAYYVETRNALGQFEYPVCDCTRGNVKGMLRKFSGLPTPPVFLNGLDSSGPALDAAVETAQAYIDGELSESILTFHGEVGTGKSHLLLSIGWALLAQGVIVKYLFVPDWLAKLRESYGESGPDPEAIYNAYDGAEVLLIDNMDGEHPIPERSWETGLRIGYSIPTRGESGWPTLARPATGRGSSRGRILD